MANVMFKISVVVAAVLLAGFLGLACSSSGLKTSAPDAAAASGGQAGSTIGSGATGGTSGMIGPGGAGGANIGGTGGSGGSTGTSQGGTGGSTTSQGAPDASTPTCLVFPACNTGDQQVTSGSRLDYSGDCPPERECYSLPAFDGIANCGSVLCVLPDGVHCDDPLLCNPGYKHAPPYMYCGPSNFCDTEKLCAQFILCIPVGYPAVCSGTWSPGGDAGTIPCCGDGLVDQSEQCDFGEANGACFDSSGKFAGYPGDTGCPPDAQVYCSTKCTLRYPIGP
jgi:hypothetical protein